MNEVVSVYKPGVIATIEQFTYADEELRQFVVYTYYDKNKEPMYVGCSKSFYNAHYFNAERLAFFADVAYVGFVFFKNESEMKDARKYFIRARSPKHNQRKCKETPILPGLDPSADMLVVLVSEMEKRWSEFLEPEESPFEVIQEELEIRGLVRRLRLKADDDGLLAKAASTILDLYDRATAAEYREDVLASIIEECGIDLETGTQPGCSTVDQSG